MQVVYYKRFRMEIELSDSLARPTLPAGYGFVAWRDDLLDTHAEVKHSAFSQEIDSVVFGNLAHASGCLVLMRTIARRNGFLPLSTWLLSGPDGPCGTVQGVRENRYFGAIQNLGVTPGYRGLGLGSALLLQALHGFRLAGLRWAMLEVTARNDGALRLYRRLGFRCTRTLYKAVDLHAPRPVFS